MFKKNLYLIFLISALLVPNYLIKSMEDPNKKPKYEDQALGDENEDGTSSETEDENASPIDIDQHCAFLEQFKEEKFAFLMVNGETLRLYKGLLKAMSAKQHKDLDDILKIVDSHFRFILDLFEEGVLEEKNTLITLGHINILLKVLSTCGMVKNSDREPSTVKLLNHITYAAFINCDDHESYDNLCWVLAKNDLLPTLDYVFNIDNNNDNFFKVFVCNNIDIKLFRYIINKVTNKDKDYWIKLFSARFEGGKTILHLVCDLRYANELQILLKIMKEKGLDLNDFIFMLDDDQKTPLDIVLENYDLIRVLINKDEEGDEINSLMYIAASKIVKFPNWMNLMVDIPQEVRGYCDTLAKIHAYYAWLKQKAAKDIFDITVHKELLIKLFNKRFGNLNLLLNILRIRSQAAIYRESSEFEYINVILAMINKCMTLAGAHTDNTINHKIEHVMIQQIREKRYADFSLLLVLGNLSPNYIFDIKDLSCRGIHCLDHLETTVLHAAAMYASRDVFGTLLNIMEKNGCNLNDFLNKQDGNGLTPLMIAAYNGRLELVELLLDCKVDANIKCNNGFTALDYAEKYLEQSSNEKKEEFAKVICLLKNATNNYRSDFEKQS